MKMLNRAILPVIATLCALSSTPSTFASEASIFAVEEGVLSIIGDFAGTSSIHGVCKKWRDINLGNAQVRGRGSFCIAWDLKVTDRDLETFKHVRKLVLDHLHGIRNVAALASIPDLTLMYLENVTDVSPLGRVDTLTLQGLPIGDVSVLGGVPNLTLKEMIYVHSVASLCSVKKLTLLDMPEIRDISTVLHMATLNDGTPREDVPDEDGSDSRYCSEEWEIKRLYDKSGLSSLYLSEINKRKRERVNGDNNEASALDFMSDGGGDDYIPRSFHQLNVVQECWNRLNGASSLAEQQRVLLGYSGGPDYNRFPGFRMLIDERLAAIRAGNDVQGPDLGGMPDVRAVSVLGRGQKRAWDSMHNAIGIGYTFCDRVVNRASKIARSLLSGAYE